MFCVPHVIAFMFRFKSLEKFSSVEEQKRAFYVALLNLDSIDEVRLVAFSRISESFTVCASSPHCMDLSGPLH